MNLDPTTSVESLATPPTAVGIEELVALGPPRSRTEFFEFRLFVAGNAHISAQALANLTVLCDTVLPGCHRIEVIDVLRQPLRALEEGVLVTPMLLKLAPGPLTRIVGTLARPNSVLLALGLDPLQSE